MTWRDVLSTEKIQEDSPKAEDNTFWSHPSYNINVLHYYRKHDSKSSHTYQQQFAYNINTLQRKWITSAKQLSITVLLNPTQVNSTSHDLLKCVRERNTSWILRF
jgi:hypothetical protein